MLEGSTKGSFVYASIDNGENKNNSKISLGISGDRGNWISMRSLYSNTDMIKFWI